MIRASVVSLLIFNLQIAIGSAASPGDAVRDIGPATIVMDRSAAFGEMQRSVVEFDHAAHTSALEAEGCTACHTIGEDGLTPKLTGTSGDLDRDGLMNAYHEACISCHERMAAASLSSGPVTCGECHVRRPPGASTKISLSFDYSLHARHSQAYPEKCETCHHVFDEAQQLLGYEKGAEEACRACHGPVDVDRTPSLANAAHRDCVGCHLQRVDGGQETGPVLCVGCHDADRQAAIEVLEPVPRLLRGQPDTMWIRTAGSTGQMVPFDHIVHEKTTSACSDCHHSRLEACGSCHGRTVADEGGGVTLQQAHHMPGSNLSCVGCHLNETRTSRCAGCHRSIARTPTRDACVTCHSGPAIAENEKEPPPPQSLATAELALLPASSRDFPETVEIDVMADTYEAARLPHRKIVEYLDRVVRNSRVAARFHQRVEVLCTGCHHNSPAGRRPPPCRSCHGEQAEPTTDMPGLYVAYHRQCIGCHQEMGLAAQGCEDCHAKRGESS